MMDDKGFIFTTDATLALVVFMVFTVSLATYLILPSYLGNDHQHLDRLAADALRIMHQDGTLYLASVQYQNGNVTGAQNTLNSALNNLIPADIGYRITLASYPPAENDRGLLYANNIVTRTDVISGPKEGWMGRAWYKVEKAEFVDQPTNVTTTLWNFHNWLTNFDPWNSNNHLSSYPYWGRGSTPQNIAFSVPSGATINSFTFLLGSSSHQNRGKSYAADVVINNYHNVISNSSFTFLNLRPGSQETMFNYQGFPNVGQIHTGSNGFYVNYLNATSYSDMPWFSIIANYTTSFKVPQGVLNSRIDFDNAAGLAVPNAQDLGDGTNAYGRIYNLNMGTVQSFYNSRIMSWNSFVSNRNTLDNYDDGIPFVIDNVNGEDGSAVSVVKEFNIPTDNVRILDAYLVTNIYGAADNAMVEVWDGTQWKTVFCSFDFDGVDYSGTDGYGNIPGILYIGDKLRTGQNKVRITLWDNAPANDYDLVGIVNSYVSFSYTRLPIRWENFAFNSYQDTDNSNQQTRTFTIDNNAKEVYLFTGSGTDTRHIKVEVRTGTGGTWRTLYDSDTVPYSLNLASLDAGSSNKVFTTGNSANYTIIPGNYRTRVTITSPSNGWESGDSYAEIFSGTRVSVLYPEFLENRWTASYASDPETAKQQARQELINILTQSGITPDPNLIREEALYTGDLPNSIPVRLELWKH